MNFTITAGTKPKGAGLRAPFRERSTGKPLPVNGFTLIELLVVISIIALLATLLTPAATSMIKKAKVIKCANNLRQIGVAVNAYLADHDNIYPLIETDPTNPVYTAADNAKGMLETLSPYGITPATLTCPEDVLLNNNYARVGTSYEWRPILDGDSELNPVVYWHATPMTVSPSKLRICGEFDNVHFNRMNYLYGDGHVRQVTKPK